jgi:O-methyltransferase
MNSLYINLLKKCLTNWIYGDKETVQSPITIPFVNLYTPKPMDESARMFGEDWPPTAHTMIGMKRLDNIEYCVSEILLTDVPGDFIECGVWRGGAAIFMQGLLKYTGKDRKVFVADSFEGLPAPDEKYPDDSGDIHYQHGDVLAIPLKEVKANFRKYDLLDENVVFIKGWFKDSLPAAPIDKLALLRIDADMYGSTMEVLEILYPKLSVGGYVIIDDYGVIEGCRKAVDDYRGEHGITERIVPIDRCGVFWRKSR